MVTSFREGHTHTHTIWYKTNASNCCKTLMMNNNNKNYKIWWKIDTQKQKIEFNSPKKKVNNFLQTVVDFAVIFNLMLQFRSGKLFIFSWLSSFHLKEYLKVKYFERITIALSFIFFCQNKNLPFTSCGVKENDT